MDAKERCRRTEFGIWSMNCLPPIHSVEAIKLEMDPKVLECVGVMYDPYFRHG